MTTTNSDQQSDGELPWDLIHEKAGTDILTIAMDFVNQRLTTSGLMEAIAEYAKAAYEVGNTRAHAPVDDERIRQIREWRAKQYGHSFTGTIGTDRAMADIDYLLALVDKKED